MYRRAQQTHRQIRHFGPHNNVQTNLVSGVFGENNVFGPQRSSSSVTAPLCWMTKFRFLDYKA